MPYSPKILQHFHNPLNLGELDKTDPHVKTGSAGAAERGDIVQIQLKFDQYQVIVDAKFKAQASVVTIAACSWLTQNLIGKTYQEAAEFNYEKIATELELSPIKLHCAVIVSEALMNALAN